MKRLMFFFGAIVMFSVTGCYDDSGVLDRLGKLENKVEVLENRLNSELDALHDMLDGTVTITECTLNDAGSYDITLSSGVKLTVKDGADLSAAITYKTEEDGSKYWAVYSDDGQTVFVTDASGKKIPISQPVPTVRSDEAGDRYLVVGDKEYPLGGESVFTSYKVNTNALTGDVLSVTFGFGEDMEFTVTVDGAHMFRFVEVVDGDRIVELTSYFVASGMMTSIMTEQVGVVSYIVEMPRGWEYERYVDEAGNRYLNVTAPSEKEIEEGALAKGTVSVVAVLEGGKAMAAELLVTTMPFENMGVLFDEMSIKMGRGVMKYMYGIMPKSSYTQEGAIAKAAELLAGDKNGVAEGNVTAGLAEVYGTELTPGEEYILWAVPALWVDEGYVVADSAEEYEFTYFTVEMTIDPVESYNDAQMSLSLQGVSKWYGGVVKKADGVLERLLSNINAGVAVESFADASYSGSVFDFADCSIIPESGATYLVWVLVDNGGSKFEMNEVVSREFTLNQIQSGGQLTLEVPEINDHNRNEYLKPDMLTLPLTCIGADRIYYAFVPYNSSTAYNTDDLKVQYILKYGSFGVGGNVTAATTGLEPETLHVLFAVAVASDGKYGNVISETYKTSAIPFNKWTVTLEEIVNKPFNVQLQITVKDETGSDVQASDFLYWAGETSVSFWKNTLGRSVAKAQKYMWLNAGTEKRLKTSANGEITDGVLKLADMDVDKECVIVMMAKDAEGNYSMAGMLEVQTLSVDFGEVVNEGDPKWEAMRPTASEDPSSTIVWLPEKFVKPVGMRSGEMGFLFNGPKGFTSYVMYGTEDYMIDYESDSDEILYGRDRMVYMVKSIDKAKSKDLIVSETESKYITEWFRFFHGYASDGAAVVFDQADIEEHKTNCSCIEEYDGTISEDHFVVYFNSAPVTFKSAAVGKDGFDKVYVMYKDSEGNFYEPYAIDVPYKYYENAQAE